MHTLEDIRKSIIAQSFKNGEDLLKAKKAGLGEVRNRADGKYQKTSQGWKKITEGNEKNKVEEKKEEKKESPKDLVYKLNSLNREMKRNLNWYNQMSSDKSLTKEQLMETYQKVQKWNKTVNDRIEEVNKKLKESGIENLDVDSDGEFKLQEKKESPKGLSYSDFGSGLGVGDAVSNDEDGQTYEIVSKDSDSVKVKRDSDGKTFDIKKGIDELSIKKAQAMSILGVVGDQDKKVIDTALKNEDTKEHEKKFNELLKAENKEKVAKVMREFKEGTLTSHGNKVTDRKQAIAIAMNEAGLAKADIPEEHLKEMIDEHEKLVGVLESESHEDDKKEAKKQKKELEEYKEQAKMKKSEAMKVLGI